MTPIRRRSTLAQTVGALILVFILWQFVSLRNPLVRDQRVVQILKSRDGRYEADLIQRHAFVDLNFIIRLNGQKIYLSPDFRPNYTVPFRPALMWDVTRENLIFEVAGQRLFGYNVTSARRLSNAELLKLAVEPVRLEILGYEGDWPSTP